MERLTTKYDGDCVPKGLCTVDRFGGIDDVVPCNIYCNETCSECVIQNCFDKLAEYEDAEEQGLLLRLPCKVGDMIYVIPSKVNRDLNVLHGMPELNRVYEQQVHSLQMWSHGNGYLLTTCDGLQSVVSTFYKETWFLTKEEAEQALKGGVV